MEGNACYKFSTIRHFVGATGASPIRTVIDVGANVGEVTTMIAEYFPEARIFAFEPVREYFDIGRQRTRHLPNVAWISGALSMQHRFADDLGQQCRARAVPLRLLKGRAEAGAGWIGGSMVLAADDPAFTAAEAPYGFERAAGEIPVHELEAFLDAQGIDELDVLKMDCEGCEHSVLGGASTALLSRIRFIPGEYHGIERFHRVLRHRLFETHKVNLIGTRDLGSFFAERRDGTRDGILLHDNTGMLQPRPWLASTMIDWHLFDPSHVLPGERAWHALPD